MRNSSAPMVISIIISFGKQGTVSPLHNKPLRNNFTIGQNEPNVCLMQDLYACHRLYDMG